MEPLDIDLGDGPPLQRKWLSKMIEEAKASLIPLLKKLRDCGKAHKAASDAAEAQGNRLFGLLLAAGKGDVEAMREVKACQNSAK